MGALNSYPPCVAEEVVNRPLQDFTTVRRKPVFNASKSSDAVIRALWTFMTLMIDAAPCRHASDAAASARARIITSEIFACIKLRRVQLSHVYSS